MASDRIKHFADPLHLLLRTRYGRDSNHVCDICRSRLAGLEGYRCCACDMDFHEACAGYFKQRVSFFAHPWHALTLAGAGWSCDLCTEACPPGSFVYRCAGCLFDVHPLCTMLPQTVQSPVHPHLGHQLRMAPSSGRCSACRGVLPVWHYVCHCLVRLHITCVSGSPTAGTGSNGACRLQLQYRQSRRTEPKCRYHRRQVPPQGQSPHGGPCGHVRLGVAGARCPRCGLRLQSIEHVIT